MKPLHGCFLGTSSSDAISWLVFLFFPTRQKCISINLLLLQNEFPDTIIYLS